MINNLKTYFTKNTNIINNLKLNKNGIKFYINYNNDTDFKKNYKHNKYVFGYNYDIKSYNFNILSSIFKIIDKKNLEYSIIVQYINLFNNNFLFLKKNET